MWRHAVETGAQKGGGGSMPELLSKLQPKGQIRISQIKGSMGDKRCSSQRK